MRKSLLAMRSMSFISGMAHAESNNYSMIVICAAVILGLFYYTLANLNPWYRSSIRSIQLIAVAKTCDIRQFGIEKLLMPFISGVNELAKVCDRYCHLNLITMSVASFMLGTV